MTEVTVTLNEQSADELVKTLLLNDREIKYNLLAEDLNRPESVVRNINIADHMQVISAINVVL